MVWILGFIAFNLLLNNENKDLLWLITMYAKIVGKNGNQQKKMRVVLIVAQIQHRATIKGNYQKV
ncbi:MAG TPA: hypothetical protein DEO86_21660 [Colwellia sp.]|nr:hypothetical protein [Colwellia sp.]